MADILGGKATLQALPSISFSNVQLINVNDGLEVALTGVRVAGSQSVEHETEQAIKIGGR
jgi:hypothetical protein